MARPLRYHPLVQFDVLNAAAWYDDRNPNLGSDFIFRVRKAIDHLAKDHEQRSTAEFGVRYWSVGRFPYVVFYDILEKKIVVLGVMHTSQEPKKWLSGRRLFGEQTHPPEPPIGAF